MQRLGSRLLQAAGLLSLALILPAVPAVESPPRRAHLRFELAHADDVLSVAFSPSGKELATRTADGTLHLWNVRTRRRVRHWSAGDRIGDLVYSPDGTLLAVPEWTVPSARDGVPERYASEARLYRTSTGALLRTLRLPGREQVGDLLFTPDGKSLFAALGSSLAVLDTRTWRLRRAVPAPGEAAMVLAVAPDGSRVAAAGAGTVVSWEPRGWRLIGEWRQPGVICAGYSPDSKLLVTGDLDGHVRIAGARTMAVHRSLPRLGYAVLTLAFSPDGRRLAVARPDAVHVYSTADWKPGASLPTRALLKSLCFSPDGRLLASVTEDPVVGLWTLD